MHQLAIIYANQGDIPQAIALYQESLQIKENIGNLQGKAATLAMLGQLLVVQGEVDTALDYLKESLEILQYVQSPEAEKVKQLINHVQQMIDNS